MCVYGAKQVGRERVDMCEICVFVACVWQSQYNGKAICIDAQQNNAGAMGVQANRTGREIEGVRGRGKLYVYESSISRGYMEA